MCVYTMVGGSKIITAYLLIKKNVYVLNIMIMYFRNGINKLVVYFIRIDTLKSHLMSILYYILG